MPQIDRGVERFYSGGPDGQVTVREGKDRRVLDLRSDLHNYAGFFSWGPKDAKGAAQLGLALLADAFGDDERAMRFHEEFTRRVVSIMPERWTISRSRIRDHFYMFLYKTAAGIPEEKTLESH